jgi:hypothetical protein
MAFEIGDRVRFTPDEFPTFTFLNTRSRGVVAEIDGSLIRVQWDGEDDPVLGIHAGWNMYDYEIAKVEN